MPAKFLILWWMSISQQTEIKISRLGVNPTSKNFYLHPVWTQLLEKSSQLRKTQLGVVHKN